MRRLVVAVLALVSIAGIVTVAVVARSRPDALAELRIRGDAVGVVRNERPLAQGQEGEPLAAGEVVRTDANGQAQVDFFDGSLVRLDSGTEVSIDRLVDGPEGRIIDLDLRGGRTWNRVAEFTSSSDTYELGAGGATAVVKGTTFVADCRGRECYFLGINGTTHVSAGNDRGVANEGDCLAVTPERGISPCDEKKLGLIDTWIKENLAEDQQLDLQRPIPSPTSTPTSTPGASEPVPAPARRAPGPTRPPPAPTPTPEVTEAPTDDPFPPATTPRPRRRRTPPPATPTPFERTPRPTRT